jgi:hypothetical protein
MITIRSGRAWEVAGTTVRSGRGRRRREHGLRLALRDQPHVDGVSYFSSKGPTGDGRAKPDLLAPGERIISCASGRIDCTVSGMRVRGDLVTLRHAELPVQFCEPTSCSANVVAGEVGTLRTAAPDSEGLGNVWFDFMRVRRGRPQRYRKKCSSSPGRGFEPHPPNRAAAVRATTRGGRCERERVCGWPA